MSKFSKIAVIGAAGVVSTEAFLDMVMNMAANNPGMIGNVLGAVGVGGENAERLGNVAAAVAGGSGGLGGLMGGLMGGGMGGGSGGSKKRSSKTANAGNAEVLEMAENAKKAGKKDLYKKLVKIAANEKMALMLLRRTRVGAGGRSQTHVDLMEKKDAAAQAEDYDEAKRFKGLVAELDVQEAPRREKQERVSELEKQVNDLTEQKAAAKREKKFKKAKEVKASIRNTKEMIVKINAEIEAFDADMNAQWKSILNPVDIAAAQALEAELENPKSVESEVEGEAESPLGKETVTEVTSETQVETEQPVAKEAEPAASEAEPAATEAEPAASEAEPTATEAEADQAVDDASQPHEEL